jgi:hypothetical protein
MPMLSYFKGCDACGHTIVDIQALLRLHIGTCLLETILQYPMPIPQGHASPTFHLLLFSPVQSPNTLFVRVSAPSVINYISANYLDVRHVLSARSHTTLPCTAVSASRIILNGLPSTRLALRNMPCASCPARQRDPSEVWSLLDL